MSRPAHTARSAEPDPFTARSLGYQVNLLARTMELALSERIRPLGVVPGQFAQLLALYEQDGQSVTELARKVAIEHSTMSRTLSRMERDDLVVTKPHPTDGRSRQVYLTAHARSLEPALKAAAGEVNALFTAEISDRQNEQLLKLVTRLTSADRALPDERP